ncbi:MAG: hypothetical protein LQ340_003173 [Diploschistes diacapsis]|nr:MAG: hypothetical protein LQ340_003173 [Diploschistes diacapsis]
MIVAELFSKQCKPWQNLVHDLFERILSSAYATVIAVLRYGVDDQTAGSLVCEIIGLFMERLKAELSMKANRERAEAQATRHRREMEKQLKTFLNVDELPRDTTGHWFNMTALLDTLLLCTEPDMMEAYYKVALENLINDGSVLAIEECLTQRLPSHLSTEAICDLTDADLQRAAGDNNESAAERQYGGQQDTPAGSKKAPFPEECSSEAPILPAEEPEPVQDDEDTESLELWGKKAGKKGPRKSGKK